MTILLISNGYPPHRSAGTEVYTRGLAHGLRRRGHAVHVLCVGDWETGDQHWNGVTDEDDGGVHVRRLHLNWAKAVHPSEFLFDNPVTAAYVAEYLRELGPAVVHVTSCETLSASILPVIKAAGVPLVLSITDFWFLCPRITLLRSDGQTCDGRTTAFDCLRCQLAGHRAYEWPRRVLPQRVLARLLETASEFPAITRLRGLRGLATDMNRRKTFLAAMLNVPDVRMTASQFTRDVFVANGVEAPILVRPYGHDLSWLQDDPGKTPSRTLRLGFIGQVTSAKGVHLLLLAAQRLRDLRERFDVRIYGNLDREPGYGETLRSLAADLPNVTFGGTYPHEQTARVFSELDVLVVPSVWYDFPLIVHEAFATRTPVVATRLGGMAEAVRHETNGLLFSCNQVEDLAAQLRRLLIEPDLVARLSAGIAPVKTVSCEADELERLYDALIGRAPAAPDP